MYTSSKHSPSLSYQRLLIILGTVALVALPNHDLLNWLFAGTVLIAWKQALAFSMTGCAFLMAADRSRTKPIISLWARRLYWFVFLSSLLLVLLSFSGGLMPFRVFYGVAGYSACLGAIFMCAAIRSRIQFEMILAIASCVGVLGSVGLLVDYFTGWFSFLPRVNEYNTLLEAELQSVRRAAFFFGTSTVIFPYLSFSLLAAGLRLLLTEGRRGAVIFAILCILVPVSTFFTGSRATFFLCALFTLLIVVMFVSALRPKTLVLAAVVVCVAPMFFWSLNFRLPDIPQVSLLTERYLDAASDEDSGNDLRFKVWSDGLQLLTGPGPNELIGVGLGSSIAMEDGHQTTPHFESSLFQSFSEGGILGLLIRYLPGLVAIIFLITKRRLDQTVTLSLLVWFLSYFIAVSTSPTAAALHTQFVYFFAVGLAFEVHRLFDLRLSPKSIRRKASAT